MKQLKLSISGEISLKTYDEVLSTVARADKFEEILLVINSSGGSVQQTFAIYDFLKSLEKNITTVTFGNCMSMATVLFSLGNKRYVGENVSYMLHQQNKTFSENETYTISQLKELFQVSLNNTIKWKKALQKSSGKIKDSFLDSIFNSTNDTFLTITQLLELNLATDILDDFNLLLDRN